MKKLLLALTILLTVFLVGCNNERKMTVERWAVEYATEYLVEKYNDDTYLINIQGYQYGYDSGEYNTGVFVDEDCAWTIFKLEVTYVGDVYEGIVYEIYVGIIWKTNYTLLDYNAQISLKDKPIKESQIIEVEIEEAGGE